MQNGYEFNSLEFITAGGAISIAVALILLAMSVASWYVMISKALQVWRANQAASTYVNSFWATNNLAVAIKLKSTSALSRLASDAIAAAEHHQLHIGQGNSNNVTRDEFVARAMNRSITFEGAQMENGLTVLASVGSVSPFVGLFGTVWGIYHALASISLSGQATLDKVAGPVGEALIMTGLGLAVAIPAVLAYNALVRANHMLFGKLENFASDLHTLLITGALINAQQAATQLSNEQTNKVRKENMRAVEVPA